MVDEQDATKGKIGFSAGEGEATLRTQAEETLLKARALQRAIFNSANFSSIATDAKGVIQIFNVGAERMLGYTAADVVNKITPADISDPGEVIARANALSAELATLRPLQGLKRMLIRASGAIMTSLLPLGATAGEPRWVQFDANREAAISIDVNSVLRVNADTRKAWIQYRYFYDKSSRALLYYVRCRERTYRMAQEIFRGPRGEVLQSQEWDVSGKYQDVEPGESWGRMIDKVCAAKLSD